jgi:hypothetical protein
MESPESEPESPVRMLDIELLDPLRISTRSSTASVASVLAAADVDVVAALDERLVIRLLRMEDVLLILDIGVPSYPIYRRFFGKPKGLRPYFTRSSQFLIPASGTGKVRLT